MKHCPGIVMDAATGQFSRCEKDIPNDIDRCHECLGTREENEPEPDVDVYYSRETCTRCGACYLLWTKFADIDEGLCEECRG